MSVVSTNISLPDASVSSGSSDISALESPQIPPPPLPSKKELWRDLKVHSISRALSSAIIVPLLHILTTSQLATLARLRYLDDVKADLPPTPPSPIRGLLHSYTIEGMGLSEFVDETTTLLNPVGLLPKAISRWLPQAVQPAPPIVEDHTEDERLYLTYSWWILNEGWKPIAQAVNTAVERVFA
jgi:peroxin-3